jgi:hypothetical protein
MIGVAKGAGKLAGAAAEGAMMAADTGLLEGVADLAGSSGGGSAPATATPPPAIASATSGTPATRSPQTKPDREAGQGRRRSKRRRSSNRTDRPPRLSTSG